MTDLIKNGCFINQHFLPWFSNDYPGLPVMPHYQGECFSVLLDTANHLQQNIIVRRGIGFTARWEYTARLISAPQGQGARIQTGLFASADHESHAALVTDSQWQVYAHTDSQLIHSDSGYLGVVFSNPLPLPDTGVRTRVQITGFKLWLSYEDQ